MGMAKAAVFPVPVWAQPIRSVPRKIIGIDSACIGVGMVYPSSLTAFKMGSMRLNDSKCINGLVVNISLEGRHMSSEFFAMKSFYSVEIGNDIPKVIARLDL